MMKKISSVVLLFLIVLMVQGCGGDNSSQRLVVPTISEQEALDRCKAYLQRYAEGQPMGSELADIDRVYDSLKNQPEKVQILKTGLEELASLSAKPSAFKQKAQEILKQLE